MKTLNAFLFGVALTLAFIASHGVDKRNEGFVFRRAYDACMMYTSAQASKLVKTQRMLAYYRRTYASE